MKIKTKTLLKKLPWRITKITWFTIGILILSWTLFWLTQIQKIGDLGGVLAGAALFGTGLYMIGIYLGITLLFILIKWVVKKVK